MHWSQRIWLSRLVVRTQTNGCIEDQPKLLGSPIFLLHEFTATHGVLIMLAHEH